MKNEWIWYKPESILELKEYHSQEDALVPLLVVFVYENKFGEVCYASKYPMLVHYFPATDEWRVQGAPPAKWSVLWWTPVPFRPVEDDEKELK